MLPFGVTISATVPQGSEIPEGLMNNPVFIMKLITRTVIKVVGMIVTVTPTTVTISIVVPWILMSSKSFIYQLVHNKISLKEY
jgi:hypothetical protein